MNKYKIGSLIIVVFYIFFCGCSIEDSGTKGEDVTPSKYPLSISIADDIRGKVPMNMRRSYIRYGESFLGQDWPALDKSVCQANVNFRITA